MFWDGPLGLRVRSNEPFSSKEGVWKSKFEDVRCAAMLMAFRDVNEELQKQCRDGKR